MRRFLKISAWLLGFLILLLMGGMVAVQSPRIQTALAQYAAKRLEKSLPAEVSIGRLTVRPFDALVLEDVLLKDPQACIEGMDTVAYVRNLTAKFSLGGLLRKGAAHVGRLKLDGGQFNLGFEPPDGSTMNIMRVLGIGESKSEGGKMQWGKLLNAKLVEITDFHFRMANPVSEEEMALEGRSYGEGEVNWNNFSIHVQELLATQLDIADSHITGTVERLRFTEKSTGFTVREASAQKVDVGEEKAAIEGLRLAVGESDVYLNHFIMDGPMSNYGKFVDRIWLDADIRPGSYLALPTLRCFSSALEGITFSGKLQGQLRGYVNDFKLDNILIEDRENGVRAAVSGSMSGLPNTRLTQLNFQVRELDFGLDRLGGFVQAWAPDTGLDLSGLAKGEDFHFRGNVSGQLDQLRVQGEITSSVGSAQTDLTLSGAVGRPAPIVIGGKVRTENLDLGRILGNSSLGPMTLRTAVEATFPRGGDMQVRIDTLQVSRLHAMGYDYSNISAVGTYRSDAFDGRIIAADPNLNFLFQGIFNLSGNTRNAQYRFFASLGYADLHALHLDSRERSKVSFQASSNFLRTDKQDLLGDITLSGISLESDTGHHNIGDVVIRAHSSDNLNRIRIESSFLEGTLVGDQGPDTFLSDLKALVVEKDLPALLQEKPKPWSGAGYDLSLKVKQAQELLNFLVPGLYVERNTTLSLKVDAADTLVTASLRSGRLAYKDKFIKDLRLSFGNAGGVQNATITGKEISLSGAQILGNNITLFADDNHFGLGYTFDNGGEDDTHAQLYLSGDLSRDAEGLLVSARALPSNLYYKGNGWGLSSEEITFRGGDIRIENFLARHNDETLLVHGGYSPIRSDTLSIRMDKFDMGLLNTLSGDLPAIGGYATGHAMVVSPTEPSMGLLVSVTCDSTYVAGERMGQLFLSSVWDEDNKRFNASASNLLDGKKNLDVDAYYHPKSRAIHAAAQLERLNLGYAAPLLSSLFHQFGGGLSGQVSLDGTLDKYHLSSKDLRIEDGLLMLDYTRVPYRAEGPLELNDQGLFFRGVSLTDGLGGKGSINGSILLGNGFGDIGLDTHVQLTGMKVLDLPRGVNNLMYGTATATGRADVTGPLSKILLNINASTSGPGDLHLTLGSSSEGSAREMLTFTQEPEEVEEDPYEVMMAAATQEDSKGTDLEVKLRIRATPELQVNIDVDESSLSASGSGTIELEYKRDNFGMGGDYNISQGSFLFSAMNLVTRKFTIQDGSSIRFNGDVWDTDLDVRGLYTTKASLAGLIADETAVSRRAVNCGINIKGRLSNPEVNFSIDVPDLNPATQAQVEGALNTVDKVQKQFVYLLLAGNFLPAEESGITTSGSDALLSNMSSIMSGQINNIFQKLDIPLDMGLNYATTQTGSNLFDVALSTQLFNNRVIVNGTVGNKQMMGGTTTNEVAGDMDIEVKLNRSGSLRMKLFTHSADQYTSYLDNSQRHGGGVSFQKDFNTFRELFRSIFGGSQVQEGGATRQAAADAMRSVVLEVEPDGKLTRK